MMILQIVITTMLLFSKKVSTSSCSSEMEFEFSYDIKSEKPLDIERTETYARKTTLISSLIMEILISKTQYLYCPAIEFGIFMDCTTKNMINKYNEFEIKRMFEEKYCLAVGDCKNGLCDGLKEEDCFKEELETAILFNTKRENSLSMSVIHHRCSRSCTCKVKTVKNDVIFFNSTHTILRNSENGDCLVNVKGGVCCWDDGYCGIVNSLIEKVDSGIKLLCVKTTNEDICSDVEMGVQFSLDQEGFGSNRHLSYLIQGQINKVPLFDHGVLNGVPTMTSLVQAYNSLEFEGLMSEYNFLLLRREVDHLKELILSMIWFELGITMDPLEKITKMPVRFSKLKDNNKMQFAVCGKNDPLDFKSKSFSPHISTNVSLFNDQDFKFVIPSSPVFDYYKRSPQNVPEDYIKPNQTRHGGSQITVLTGKELIWSFIISMKEVFFFISCLSFWIISCLKR